MMRVLHAGCGTAPYPDFLPPGDEVRLDIDPASNPHVVAPITAMGDIGQFQLAYCSHCLEHIPQHEVQTALGEFRRVLTGGGALVLVVPDLEGIACDDTVIYESEAGPVTGRDLYYGKADMVEVNPWMGHKTGFVAKTLRAELEKAGFTVRNVVRSQTNIIASAFAP